MWASRGSNPRLTKYVHTFSFCSLVFSNTIKGRGRDDTSDCNKTKKILSNTHKINKITRPTGEEVEEEVAGEEREGEGGEGRGEGGVYMSK